jgi:hypothetical protein
MWYFYLFRAPAFSACPKWLEQQAVEKKRTGFCFFIIRVQGCGYLSVLPPDKTDSLVSGQGGSRVAHAHILARLHVLAAMCAAESVAKGTGASWKGGLLLYSTGPQNDGHEHYLRTA